MAHVLRVYKAANANAEQITLQTINDSNSRMAIMGFRIPDSTPKITLPKRVRQAIATNRITEDEYVAMLTYQRLLPRGKRKLKLNYPELRDQLIAVQEIGAPLTDSSGLNDGGKLSLGMPVKKLKEMTQREHNITIKNKNRVFSPENATPDGKNPNPTSWKNTLKI